MNKKYFKKYSSILIFSMSILAPMTLASCSYNLAKEKDKDQKESTNLSEPNKSNTSKTNTFQDKKDSTNKIDSQESSKTQSQNTSESNQNTKVDSSKTNNLATNQNNPSKSNVNIQETNETKQEQNINPNNAVISEKQAENDKNASSLNSKQINNTLKNQDKTKQENDQFKQESKDSSNFTSPKPITHDPINKVISSQSTTRLEMPKNDQSNSESEDNKKSPESPKWWEKLNQGDAILDSFNYDQNSLVLNFKQSMPLDVETSLKLENIDTHEEKEISFKTTNGKAQNVLLSSSDLTSGKWKIKSFRFNKNFSYSPKIETTFDFKTNEKQKQERIEKIQKAIDKYQINIRQIHKDKADISKYALSNFDLNLNLKNFEIINNFVQFDGSNLDQDLKSEKQMLLTFEKVSEDKVNKTRKAHFKISTLDNLIFEKTLEWAYKTNEEYLQDFRLGSALWNDLERKLSSIFQKSLWHPYQLPRAKSQISTINLIDEVSASFQGYDHLDDFKGQAKLKFKLIRGQQQRDITFTISGFLRVSLIDPKYKGNLRNSEFIVKASSNGYWLGQYYTAFEVFKHYSNNKSYWYASSNDANPWLEFSWKDKTPADIYGFELLFWNEKDYYKKGSYRVEYKTNANSEWKALENVEITSMPFEKDKRFIQEIVKVKKERISGLRIVFLKDKKPTYPSIFSLNPIVRIAF